MYLVVDLNCYDLCDLKDEAEVDLLESLREGALFPESKAD